MSPEQEKLHEKIQETATIVAALVAGFPNPPENDEQRNARQLAGTALMHLNAAAWTLEDD